MELYRKFIQAAPAAEAMEQLFANLQDVMFCIKDRQDRYLCANQAFLLRVGILHHKTIVGKTTRDVFPHTLALTFEQQDREVTQSGVPIFSRLDVVTNPDRSLGWYITDKAPIFDSRNQIIAVASTTRDLKSKVVAGSEMELIVDFVNLLRDRFTEPIQIAKLAAESGIPLHKLERRMRSIMATSPRQLLTRIRVQAAAESLRKSNDRLSEIAYRYGFCDQPTFCRQFKNVTGLTASQYRSSFLQKGPEAEA